MNNQREVISWVDFNNSLQAAAVIGLLDEYAQHEMGGRQALSDFVKQNLISELQRRPHTSAVLATIEGVPAGLAICVEGFSTFACQPIMNIHDIMVSEAFRGDGLSHRLLQHIEEKAQELGCCKLTLEVLEGNRIAQKAYKSFGFAGYELDPSLGGAMFWQKLLK